jgi:hypothetical protein
MGGWGQKPRRTSPTDGRPPPLSSCTWPSSTRESPYLFRQPPTAFFASRFRKGIYHARRRLRLPATASCLSSGTATIFESRLSSTWTLIPYTFCSALFFFFVYFSTPKCCDLVCTVKGRYIYTTYTTWDLQPKFCKQYTNRNIIVRSIGGCKFAKQPLQVGLLTRRGRNQPRPAKRRHCPEKLHDLRLGGQTKVKDDG